MGAPASSAKSRRICQRRDSDALDPRTCFRCGMIHRPAIDEYDCIDLLRDRLAMLESTARTRKNKHKAAYRESRLIVT